MAVTPDGYCHAQRAHAVGQRPGRRGSCRHRHHGNGRWADLLVRLWQRPHPSPCAWACPCGLRHWSHPLSTYPSSGSCSAPAPRPERRDTRSAPAGASTVAIRQPRHPRLERRRPLVAGEFGKAMFDAVGPLLLIGWAEVGPQLLQAGAATRRQLLEEIGSELARVDTATDTVLVARPRTSEAPAGVADRRLPVVADGELVDHARREDARH